MGFWASLVPREKDCDSHEIPAPAVVAGPRSAHGKNCWVAPGTTCPGSRPGPPPRRLMPRQDRPAGGIKYKGTPYHKADDPGRLSHPAPLLPNLSCSIYTGRAEKEGVRQVPAGSGGFLSPPDLAPPLPQLEVHPQGAGIEDGGVSPADDTDKQRQNKGLERGAAHQEQTHQHEDNG